MENWNDHSRAFSAGSSGGRDGRGGVVSARMRRSDRPRAGLSRGRGERGFRARTRDDRERKRLDAPPPCLPALPAQREGLPDPGRGEIRRAKAIKAYYDLAKKYHPDANKDDSTVAAKFQEVQKAYEVLKDPAQSRRTTRWSTAASGHGERRRRHGGGGGGPLAAASAGSRLRRRRRRGGWTSRTCSATSSGGWGACGVARGISRPPCASPWRSRRGGAVVRSETSSVDHARAREA